MCFDASSINGCVAQGPALEAGGGGAWSEASSCFAPPVAEAACAWPVPPGTCAWPGAGGGCAWLGADGGFAGSQSAVSPAPPPSKATRDGEALRELLAASLASLLGGGSLEVSLSSSPLAALSLASLGLLLPRSLVALSLASLEVLPSRSFFASVALLLELSELIGLEPSPT